MQVYRADEAEAAKLAQILKGRGVRTKIERYGSEAVYVVASTDSPDVAQLAQTAGRTVRRVPRFDEWSQLG
jgi:hypothetical protein